MMRFLCILSLLTLWGCSTETFTGKGKKGAKSDTRDGELKQRLGKDEDDLVDEDEDEEGKEDALLCYEEPTPNSGWGQKANPLATCNQKHQYVFCEIEDQSLNCEPYGSEMKLGFVPDEIKEEAGVAAILSKIDKNNHGQCLALSQAVAKAKADLKTDGNDFGCFQVVP